MNQISHPGTGLSAQDERAIHAVLIAYATGIDQRDWSLFRSCFTSDCICEYGDFGTWHSATEITAFMKEAHSDLGATLHRISNIDLRVTGDTVRSRCYVDALLCPQNEGGPIHRGIGFYEDRLLRTGNGWQIAHRKFEAVLIE